MFAKFTISTLIFKIFKYQSLFISFPRSNDADYDDVVTAEIYNFAARESINL